MLSRLKSTIKSVENRFRGGCSGDETEVSGTMLLMIQAELLLVNLLVCLTRSWCWKQISKFKGVVTFPAVNDF